MSSDGAAASSHLRFLSTLPPVPCREDLAQLASTYFTRTGNACEVGVYQGGFAQHNLRAWPGQYYGVDAWCYRKDDLRSDKNFHDPKINDRNHRLALNRTAAHGDRVHLLRRFSLEAARSFPDAFFDWIFLDALHTYEAAKADVHAWWPKLREGGLLSGDDYGDSQDTEFIDDARRWRTESKKYWQIPSHEKWGVVRATRELARDTGAVLHVTYLRGRGLISDPTPSCYFWPAWYLVKSPPHATSGTVGLNRSASGGRGVESSTSSHRPRVSGRDCTCVNNIAVCAPS